jgi:hypothetical protein
MAAAKTLISSRHVHAKPGAVRAPLVLGRRGSVAVSAGVVRFPERSKARVANFYLDFDARLFL